jgi:hemolysin activation/secretion protein
MSRGIVALVTLGAWLAPVSSMAQQAPPGAQPGRIEQDVQRPREPVPREPIVIDRSRFPDQVPAGAESRRFVLSGVSVAGNQALALAELQPLWRAKLGQEISVAEAFAIAEAVTALYRERGFVLSQAIVPPQELPTSGATLRIEVLEGFIDQIRFSAPEDLAARLQPLVAPLRQERPLRLRTLERYLLLLNERAGIVARANLSRSASVPGASDVEIVVTRVPAAYSVFVSNRSPESLGKVRLEGAAEFRDPLRLFDRHAVRLLTSGDDKLAFVSYNVELPVGVEGTKVGAGLSASRSKPDTGLPFELDTRSDTLTLNASHPFMRSRRSNVDARLAFSAYNNGSDIASAGISRDRIRALRAGVAADFTDDFGGVNLFDVEVSKGLSGLGASPPGDPLLSRAAADPRFTKANVYAARLQSLTEGLSVLLAASGQYSNDILVTAEQFSLGGETFLRAFDSSEVLGDRGIAAKAELRWSRSLGKVDATWYAFYDVGRVERLEAAGGRSATSLRSFGAGVRATMERVRTFIELAKPGLHDPASTGDRDVRVFGGIGADF